MKRDNIQKACALCENGKMLVNNESALCKYKGPVSASFSCRRFVFDPLKMDAQPKKLIIKSKIETL